MNTFKHIIAAGIIASIGTAAAANDITVNAEGERIIAVYFDDLNLASEAGREALDVRIAVAAKRVCGDNTARKTLAEHMIVGRCVKTAMDGAQTSLAANKSVTVVAKLDVSKPRR